MKKLLLATAILASSTVATTASANMDFALLGGYDSDSLLAFGAELGFNDVLVGYQSYGSTTMTIGDSKNGFGEQSTNDWGLYGGYRLGNGLSLKAGAVFTDLTINYGPVNKSTSTIRPMIGAGYGAGNWSFNLHYAVGTDLSIGEGSGKQTVTWDGNLSLMAGYRF